LRILLLALLFSLSLFTKERIVALSPAINEIIFALGEGESIVGNTDYSSYPDAAKNIEKIGGYFSPNLEKIVALKPTMVIMQDNNIKLANQLDALGIKSMVVKIQKVDDIVESIKKIGAFFNQKAKAKSIIKDIDEGIESLKDIVTDQKILIVFGTHSDLNREIFVSGQNLYFNDLIEYSGNTNAFYSTIKGQPILNLEKVITLNPDIVIIIAPKVSKEIKKESLLAQWQKLPFNASQNRNIYLLDSDYVGIPSDRIIYLLRDFKEVLLEARSR